MLIISKQKVIPCTSKGCFSEASNKYTKAVKSLCFVTPLERKVEALFKELVVSLNLNLAAYYIKLDKTYKALEICTLILQVDKHNVKALCRRASSCISLGMWKEALDDLTMAKKIEPNNKEVLKEFDKVSSMVTEELLGTEVKGIVEHREGRKV